MNQTHNPHHRCLTGHDGMYAGYRACEQHAKASASSLLTDIEPLNGDVAKPKPAGSKHGTDASLLHANLYVYCRSYVLSA